MLNQSKIFVYGSIAYDVLFSIPQDFRDPIVVKNNEIKSFNATYVSNEKTELRGGTAGNIAYYLGQLNTPATVFSSVGKDFDEKGYRQLLTDFGHDVTGPIGEFTAHCYQASDTLHQQLVIWQPNSYELIDNCNLTDFIKPEKIQKFELAIFSPGTPEGTVKHLKEFRKHNKTATVLLDPSQNISRWNKQDFLESLDLCNFLIGNDSEFVFYKKMMAGNFPDHLHCIQTFGDKGVVWQQIDEIKSFPAEPINQIVETTGAGDAFRAGLLSGMIQQKSFEEALILGNKMGAKAVQCRGAQG